MPKVAWEAIEPETIQKCLIYSGVQENYKTPPNTPEERDDCDNNAEFAEYFQNLLDIPWDEYLAMDQELESELPSRAPDTQAYTIDNNDHDQDQNQDETPPINPEDALNYFQQIQK